MRYPDVVEKNPLRLVVRKKKLAKAAWILFPITKLDNCVALVASDSCLPIGTFAELLTHLRQNLSDTVVFDAPDYNDYCAMRSLVRAPRTIPCDRSFWRVNFLHMLKADSSLFFTTLRRALRDWQIISRAEAE